MMFAEPITTTPFSPVARDRSKIYRLHASVLYPLSPYSHSIVAGGFELIS